jgi:uncharacterized protein YjbI with pentapeptide repeats
MKIGNYEIKAGADLQEVDFSYQDLQYVNLQGANLQNSNLEGCNLKGSNLRFAKLQNANLTNANLENTDLHGANLQDANLNNAQVKGMNSSQETNFLGTIFDKENAFSVDDSKLKNLENQIQELMIYKEIYEEIKSKMVF